MPDLLTLLQLSLSALLAGVIAERVFYLRYTAPLSRAGLSFVLEAIADRRDEALRVFAHGTARTHVGRILKAAFPGEQATERREAALAELLFELTAETTARLRALRIGATLASTLGLLVGIVRLRGGFARPGLLALQAGLSERMAVADALFSMAIGVGTSAVCFYALSVLREAARAVIAQRAGVEKAIAARLRALSPPRS